MSKMKRRTFNTNLGLLGSALIAGCSDEESSSTTPSGSATAGGLPASTAPATPGATAPASPSSPAPPSSPVPATGTVPMGSSGLEIPRLAMGTGTAGWEGTSSQTELGPDAFVRLMRHGIDQGASFLDTADLYGSHPLARLVLQEVPRDSLTVASKIWWRDDGGLQPARTARPEVERFLTELGTDYLDIVLIHSLLNDTWQTDLAQMRDELSELKQQGVVRAVGCSCHTYATLRQAAEDPWVDVIFARVNPAGIRMDQDGSIDEITAALRLARTNGKGVVGMKIYGDGGYASPEQRLESLHFAFDNEFVDAITIGHMSEAQFDDTLANMQLVLG